ncbi:hypothetical protein FIBSPDRAFT_540427 [Athelia psychrophila]|uniref:Uncharacterized protein n=1 Tax=Athelia psychrophila TaxID=1759441 RepID=A0A166IX68_9AGAM|nr:hypothetical protein FIBSPDRAFT_540427 [Fibularhizoctonia sp. CBS 109695]
MTTHFKVYTILSSLRFAVHTISLYRNIAYHSYVKYVVLLMPFTLLPLRFTPFNFFALRGGVFSSPSSYVLPLIPLLCLSHRTSSFTTPCGLPGTILNC